MLELTLLRHAKSSWVDAELADHDRPLSPRGRSAAPLIGVHLSQRWSEAGKPPGPGGPPNVVICSTAARTRETWSLASAAMAERPTAAVFEPKLYLAGADALLQVLTCQPDTARHVMLVGHNPDMHDLACSLFGSGRAEDIARLRDKLPTTGLVVMTFRVRAWSRLAAGSGRLVHFTTPRRLEAE